MFGTGGPADQDAARSSVSGVVRLALGRCRSHFLYAGLFSGCINLLYLAPSIYMLQVYDRVVPTRGTPTLLLLTLVLTFALLVFVGLDVVRMQLLQRASVRLERIAAPSLLSLSMGATTAPVGPRAQIIRDLDTIRGTMTGPAVIALFDAPWAPVFLIVSYLLHPLFGLFALVCSALLVAIAVLGERANSGAVRAVSAETADVYRSQDQALQASEVIGVLGMRSASVINQLSDRVRIVQKQGAIARASGGYLAATKFLRLLFQSLALGLGAWLAINQQISAGSIFAASLLLGRALQPIEQILGALKNVLAAREAYRSLTRITGALDTGADRTALPAPRGHLTAEGVTVMMGDRLILKNISFWNSPGEVLALVGPSGAGKSTLLRALAGAIVPQRGEIRIDGACHADWDGDALGRHIGYMPQDPTLLPFTVHANISRLRAFVEGPSEELDRKVVEAAMAAGAHEMILRLPRGYDTDLRGRDGGLSAGQRQAVALARALFDNPSVVLLDEPNAHLDGESEARLLRTIAHLKTTGASIVVSSHRTGILQVVDTILVLRDGAIQALGPRDAVLRPTGEQSQTPAVPAVESSELGAAA